MKKLAVLALIFSMFLTGECVAQAPLNEVAHSYIQFPSGPAASSAWKVQDLCQAYTFPTKLKGGGVIGILELGGGWSQTDLDKFSQLNGLPKISVTNVSVNGGTNNFGHSSADFEVELDIEVSAAAYYYATGKMPTIKVFFAPNSSASFVSVINAAVSNGCDVLSISWGGPEKTWSSNTAQQIDAAAKAAALKGLVIFAAAGDNSSSDGTSGTNVDLPASVPHIVGCGGTNKSSRSEVVWGDGKAKDGGTGGGYSKYFPVQSFQRGAPKGPGRMVPDVAATADPNTGYRIVVRGAEVVVGGTSAVSPLYSGLFAAFGNKLGFVTPTLWITPADFADITKGSNGKYSAAKGPDACTGLGAPNGAALAALFKAPSGAFQVAAVGTTSGANNATLPVDPSGSLLSLVTGNGGNALGGDYAALVVDPKAVSSTLFDSMPARVYGIGGGLTAKGLELFLFTGRN